MESVNVKLNDIEAVKKFINSATKSACAITLVSGRYVIDGKSIMGVFSLDLSKAVECQIEGSREDIGLFLTDIEDWVE